MRQVETGSIMKRVGALITSGVLAASTVGAPMAFADDPQSSTSSQTGTGSTEVTVKLIHDGDEMGGTEDEKNPDNDEPKDKLGDNIAFTVPVAINFVAKADGTLVGPDESATYIENNSVFEIHASSLKVDTVSGWNLVEDVEHAGDKANANNLIDFQVGPDGDMLNAAKFIGEKKAVTKPEKWNMTYKQTDSDTSNPDRVNLKSGGNIAHVDASISEAKRVALMHWYVTPGKATATDGS